VGTLHHLGQSVRTKSVRYPHALGILEWYAINKCVPALWGTHLTEYIKAVRHRFARLSTVIRPQHRLIRSVGNHLAKYIKAMRHPPRYIYETCEASLAHVLHSGEVSIQM
jgi:hypothetical protein